MQQPWIFFRLDDEACYPLKAFDSSSEARYRCLVSPQLWMRWARRATASGVVQACKAPTSGAREKETSRNCCRMDLPRYIATTVLSCWRESASSSGMDSRSNGLCIGVWAMRNIADYGRAARLRWCRHGSCCGRVQKLPGMGGGSRRFASQVGISFPCTRCRRGPRGCIGGGGAFAKATTTHFESSLLPFSSSELRTVFWFWNFYILYMYPQCKF